MKIDDFRTKLASMVEDGADIAAITDELMSDYAERLQEIEAATEKDATIEGLTGRIAALNETNMKLVNRIKYTEETTQKPAEPEVTLENLFD